MPSHSRHIDTTAPHHQTALPRFKPGTKTCGCNSPHEQPPAVPAMPLHVPTPTCWGPPISSQVPPPPKSEESAAQQGSQRPCSHSQSAALCPLLALPPPLNLDTEQENKTHLLGLRPTWPLRTRLGWGQVRDCSSPLPQGSLCPPQPPEPRPSQEGAGLRHMPGSPSPQRPGRGRPAPGWVLTPLAAAPHSRQAFLLQVPLLLPAAAPEPAQERRQ